jgi:uncharacterized protein YyaL (SSP411 family)
MMNFRIPTGLPILAMILCGLILGANGCRKRKVTREISGSKGIFATELQSNMLGSLPGSIYHNQKNSPIHWQPWTKETMARAKEANRLVFGVIAMPQLPGFQSVLKSLAADPALVAVINKDYVPVLIDGDASREMGLLAADLCSEIRRGLQMPLFVWMTPDGNPVAWTPVANTSSVRGADLFNQSHSMVGRMWQDDSAYISKNSTLDNAARRDRIGRRKNSKEMSEQPAEDVLRALRQLASFYDPDSRTFDEAGGLFPSGTIELLATAAIHPGLPLELRSRCKDTTRELLLDLLPSAMFDPLEGGVFTTRRANSWDLPVFSRDCISQTRAVVALCAAYRATDDPRVLEKAIELASFSEKHFTTAEGLFAVGMTGDSDTAAWLWSIEDIEKALPPEDAKWWIKATGIKALGNLPSEADPQREFFRGNSMGMRKSLAQLAADQAQSIEVFSPRFDAARKKLIEVRNSRLGQMAQDESSHAGASFRMVSAYAALYGVTGDLKFREKACDLLGKSKEAFSDGPRLRMFSMAAPQSIGAGRAFLYGLAMQAALDVSDITSDEKWKDWTEDLATTAAELFTASGFLKECPDDAKIIDLPITDLVMLFDDSTSGLISFAECRLSWQARPLVATFSEMASPLASHKVDRPILHTDLLQATLAREFKMTAILGPRVSPEMKLAVERLQFRMIQRRAAKPSDAVPDEAVMVVLPSGETRLASTPEALREAVLPSSTKL